MMESMMEKSQQITLPVVEIYLAIEEQILINVAKRLKRHKSLMDEDIQSWQLMKLQELGSLTQENIITIARHSGLAIDEVSRMLEQAGYTAVTRIDEDIAVEEAVRRGLLIRPSDASVNPVLEQILDSRSEEHTSALQSRENLVCRLLLE